MTGDKFVMQYGSVHDPMCNRCIAFPKGIPVEIIGKADHTKPFKNDHGIRYEAGEPSA